MRDRPRNAFQHKRLDQPPAAWDPLADALARSAAAEHALFLGNGTEGPVHSRREEALLVLGPPRSGKTASIVVPNVLAAAGPVLSASTKPDVLYATRLARGRWGDCRMFDPSGTIEEPPRTTRIAWTPLRTSRDWDGAVMMVEAMVGAARPDGGRGESAHWIERASALLAPLLHAAALDDAAMPEVLAWVDRREPQRALRILAAADTSGGERAMDLLSGIVKTDEREASGIWSTASGVLAAYRTDAGAGATTGPCLDAAVFAASSDTLYVVAPGRHQRHAAPLIAGIVEDVRAAAYGQAAVAPAPAARNPPLLLALDELANIAPLRELPAIVSEGGSQGLVTLACLQDLSQARARWGVEADGFLSLFGTKLLLPGIGDVRTLETVSALCGEHRVTDFSVTRAPSLLRRGKVLSATETSRSVRWLAVDEIARGRDGHALALDSAGRFGFVELTPYHRDPLWSAVIGDAAARSLGSERRRDLRGTALGRGRDAASGPPARQLSG
jgi:type IV secretory pathway TraG/TraD family ATPase VirD4